MRFNRLIVSAGFSVLLLPLFVMACSSSNLGTPRSGANPAACPAANPLGQTTCYSDDDGGVFSCNYPCGEGETGTVNVTCDGAQWHAGADNCKAVEQPAPVGPIACGNDTCAADEYCAHECCDETPCTRSRADGDGDDAGACPVGSHAVPDNGGECAGGCIDDHPECLPSDTCQKGTPPSDCVGNSRWCGFDCA